MSYYEDLILQPLSLRILHCVFENDEKQAKEIAEMLSVGTRQVDAAVSKSLQRYGLVVRNAKLTPLKKKAYNVLKITDSGKKYIEYLAEKENNIESDEV